MAPSDPVHTYSSLLAEICQLQSQMFPPMVNPTNKANRVFMMNSHGVRTFISNQPGQCSKGYGVTVGVDVPCITLTMAS